MKQPAKAARVFLDSYAMHGAINAAEMDVTQELADATCLSDQGGRVVVGNYRHKHTLRAFFDGSSSQADAVSQALLGTTADHYLAEAFAGLTEGNPSYESVVQSAGKPMKAASGSAIMMDVPLEGNSGLSRSQVVRYATLGASDTGTSIDRGAGASTASGPTFQATFRFLPSTGTWTNAVLQLQHSSDNLTWADSAALTATSTGNAKAVRTTTTAALNRYLRVIATTLAGGTDLPILVTAGRVAGTA
jgi:hypothetical protein